MDNLREYEVTLSVTGYYKVRVHAEDEDDAIQVASDMWSDADFGELTNIDAEVWSVN